MTESFEQQYYELINQAARLPRSDAQVAPVEEAVRLADLHQDAKKSFAARIQLVDTANQRGEIAKAFDQRNKTSRFADRLARVRDEAREVKPFPIKLRQRQRRKSKTPE